MKKYIVIGLIVLVGLALLIGLLMNGGGEIPESGGSGSNGTQLTTQLPATFNFKAQGNPATVYQTTSDFGITLHQKDIALLEVIFDGEVIQSYKNPKSNLKFQLTPDKIGTYSFELVATLKDGAVVADSRSLRIVSDVQPKMMQANIVASYKHDVESFTQGLEFNGKNLYEGTGLYGKSQVRQVNLLTGEVIRKIQLDGTYFGEGITFLNNQIYQLTWQKGRCFTYDYSAPDHFTLKSDFSYIGEGWGLCNDGTELIMSDGTEFIVFRNPETFQETRKIQVYNDRGPINLLNELEYIDGKIYANVYQTNIIIAIDPATGRVLEQINCDQLIKEGQGSGDVLNGIAQDPSGKIYMTGKNWPKLFEVSFSETLP